MVRLRGARLLVSMTSYFRRLAAVVKSVPEVGIAVPLEPDHVRTPYYRALERLREFVRYTIGQRQVAHNDAPK